MDDQRDLISNHEQLPMLGQRPRAPESRRSGKRSDANGGTISEDRRSN